ncbi:MAG: GGDEF domain-containing protein [Deltaproteobacteria bacterium]|nr:GGDEF domain-containing protein [Deltaproteobacteria bacterium]
MFWKKSAKAKSQASQEAASKPSAGANDDRESSLDDALDTLAVVLRAAGEAAADVHIQKDDEQKGKELFEAWAQHLLVMAPPPGVAEHQSKRHDWGGLRRSVRGYMSKEGVQVKEALIGFKSALQTLMTRISRAVSDDEGTDGKAKAQLERIRDAVKNGSVAEMRRTVLTAVDEIGGLLDERKTRQRAMARELGDRVKTLSIELEEVKKEAATDALTGLDNRKAFDYALSRAGDQHTLFGEQSCLMIIDADHFKNVNDTYGHPTGDAVLVALANELAKAFPRRGDCVARYGGEEFAVVLRESDVHDGDRLAERVLNRIQSKVIEHDGLHVQITVSIGVAVSSEAEDSAAWLKRADAALYHAKETGRNRVCVDLGNAGNTGLLHA